MKQDSPRDGAASQPGATPVPGHPWHLISLLSFALALIALLAAYCHMPNRFPYYFRLDYDFYAMRDMVRISSGQHPVLGYTAVFGAHLLLSITHKLSYLLGQVSVLTFNDLAACLNPLAAAAELTDFFRGHSPFVAFATVIFGWASLETAFRLSTGWRLAILTLLGTQQGFLYESCMIRGEAYAALFWAAALFCLVLTLRARRSPCKLAACLAMGFFLGLCFLTKIQFLFHLGIVPFLMVFLAQTAFRHDGAVPFFPPERHRLAFSLLNSVNLSAFLALFALGLTSPSVGLLAITNYPLGVTHVVLAACGALFFLLVAEIALPFWSRRLPTVWYVPRLLTIAAAGFLASFLMHFLLYSSPRKSFALMISNFQVLFLTPNLYSGYAPWAIRDMEQRISDFLGNVAASPEVFVLHLAALLLLILACRRRGLSACRWVVGSALGSTAIALAGVFLAARNVLVDAMMVGFLLNFVSALFILAAVMLHPSRSRAWVWVCAAFVLTATGAGIVNASDLFPGIDGEMNFYGWTDKPWRRDAEAYEPPDDTYRQIIRGFDADEEAARRQALFHRENRRLAGYVFKNQRVTMRQIGVVAKSQPVWTRDLGWRIDAFPARLEGAMVVDSAALPVLDRYYFKARRVPYLGLRGHPLDEGERNPAMRCVAVLTRADIEALIFVPQKDVDAIRMLGGQETSARIALAKEDDRRDLVGVKLPPYTEVPTAEIDRAHFFVIRYVEVRENAG